MRSRTGGLIEGARVTIPIRFAAPAGRPEHVLNLLPGNAAVVMTPLTRSVLSRDLVLACPTSEQPKRRCLGHQLDWTRRPWGPALDAFWRDADQPSGVSLLECIVREDGQLSPCGVGGDATPATKAALLQTAKCFLAPAQARDGTATAGNRVLIEIDWDFLRGWREAAAFER